jgi:hypothetical protein
MDQLRQLLQNQHYEEHETHVSTAIYDNMAVHWPYFKANYTSFDTLPRKSPSQLPRLLFKVITISGSIEPVTLIPSKVRLRILKPLVIRVLCGLFWIMGEGGLDLLFESRSIIATARTPKNESP